MKKNIKLSLNDLKVKSFVTSLKEDEINVLKAGARAGATGHNCMSDDIACGSLNPCEPLPPKYSDLCGVAQTYDVPTQCAIEC